MDRHVIFQEESGLKQNDSHFCHCHMVKQQMPFLSPCSCPAFISLKRARGHNYRYWSGEELELLCDIQISIAN